MVAGTRWWSGPDTRWREMKQNRLFFQSVAVAVAVQFLEQPFRAAIMCGLPGLFGAI